MNFFSFFRSERLTPEWSFVADGIVWRLLFTGRGRIVGECRNQEKKTTSFFCLSEESGKPVWQGLRLDEDWWVGMEAVHGDTLLLHGFASPDMPEHRGIRSYDLETGSLRWRKDEVTYWFGMGDRIFAYRDFFERRVGYEIDPRTGELKTAYEQSLQELHDLRRQAAETEPGPDMTLPEILSEGSVEPAILIFVSRLTKGKGVVGNVEFIRESDILAFNYHVRARESTAQTAFFENHLFIYRYPHGNRLFSDVTARDLKAQVPDSFFIRRRRLFFIKDQKTLTALRLWK
ncbi:MAG: DUF4905 domain-containing protein [Bacteroidota bacterium]|jgi:hypothetical protein